MHEPSPNVLARLHGPRDIRLETETTVAAPGAGEVTVRVAVTGLCGSDLHYYLHGANGDFKLQHPMCLGHEAAGIIVAVGEQAGDWQVGDRVAIEAGLSCRNAQQDCRRCAEERYNLCPRMRFASSAKTAPHLDGTLRQYMTWPASFLHRLPASVSLLSAALAEPPCVVLQAFERCRFGPAFSTAPAACSQLCPAPLSQSLRSEAPSEESLLVLGAGAVGLLACAAARLRGARTIVVADIDDGRLAFAKRMGWVDGTHLLPRLPKQSGVDPLQARRESAQAIVESAGNTVDGGFDLVLECTGVPSCVQTGIFAARAGGRVGLIGMGHAVQDSFPIGAAALREVDLIGVFRYANKYPQAIELLADSEGSANTIENLASHRFPLASTSEAFETLARGEGGGTGVIKVFVIEEGFLEQDERERKIAR